LQKNKKANRIISAQKKEVEYKNHIIEEKQTEILASITYAKRLQDAILPAKEYIHQYLPDNFILYKPKDIVAGDFYWMEHIDNITFIAAADSTGHGVPGAMVSVVCSNAMNRAVKEFDLRETGTILDKTRELVLETFAKSTTDVKDGMDISLLSINRITKEVSWSGANNQLWFTENGKIIGIKANKQPIGKVDNPKPFTTHHIDYSKGTLFYLLTDGYPDQFGGINGKKFKYKQLEELLTTISSLNLQEQSEILDQKFEEWRGNLEQVDDVTIVAVKL
jgi:serine phosphatase RsbU (regulator of sigma subunit)